MSPDGKKTIVVPNVHTHELYMDADDNLYGEHLWYNGERINTWGYYIWCLNKNGTLTKLKEEPDSFRTDYSFVRDSSGNMYWVERFTVSRFKKKSPDGTVVTIAEGKFRDIRWSYCSKDGIYYFIDLDRLYKLTPDGKFTLITDRLDDTPTVLGYLNDKRHRVYGIWTDSKENIYVALLAAKKVKRISPDGMVTTIIRTKEPWAPLSGVFDKEGNLWLLEGSVTNDCRVKKITADKLQSVQAGTASFFINTMLPASIVVFILTLFLLLFRKLLRVILSPRKPAAL
jgi:hypothetical protein